jgi:hypothetical protein
VRTLYSESKYDLKSKGIFVYTPVGRRHFIIRSEAMEFAEDFGRKLILDYMAESGLSPGQVTISVEKKDIKTNASETPIETRLIFEGVANSDVYRKALSEQDKHDKSTEELTDQVNSLECNSPGSLSISGNYE